MKKSDELPPPSPSHNVFHFDENQWGFEDYGRDETLRLWSARDLMAMLGYQHWKSFQQALNRAMGVCMTLNIPVVENFVQVRREIDGEQVPDYHLSKFACYLTAMNADVRKPNVASAQAYFATLAQAFQTYIAQAEDVERVKIRGDVSAGERSLNSTAKRAGLINYAYFQNSGYLGMYNMSLKKLCKVKGIPDKRTPLDFMGKEELAANLFRITQTEAKIRNDEVKGQRALENTARRVGEHVRNSMQELSGTLPELLETAPDIKRVHSDLKRTRKGLLKK